MAPRREKTEKATADQGSQMIFEYLKQQNRPYSVDIMYIFGMDFEELRATAKPSVKDELIGMIIAYATKALKELHEGRLIAGKVAGKQIVYHALQDSKDIASLEDLRTMDKETDDLREAIVTARVKEKLLRASLVSVTATMSINDIQASIITLQSEKKMILARLEPLMAGSIEPASLQEKEEIDRAWKDWSQKANVIKRLCMELWAFCTEELQEQSKQDLWDEIGLETDEQPMVGGM